MAMIMRVVMRMRMRVLFRHVGESRVGGDGDSMKRVVVRGCREGEMLTILMLSMALRLLRSNNLRIVSSRYLWRTEESVLSENDRPSHKD